MQIIDFERKGNVVRFYLGEKTKKYGWINPKFANSDGTLSEHQQKTCSQYWGDDWNDRPFEHNAGRVYDEFIAGYRDIAFDFDDMVLDPSCTYDNNSEWSKEDMVHRRVPCIIVVPKRLIPNDWFIDDQFCSWVGHSDVKKYYFGDEMDPL